MSITLSHEMFSSLSKACRDELLDAFSNSAIKSIKNTLEAKYEEPEKPAQTISSVTAFESAALTFGKPLVLPKYVDSNDVMEEPVAEIRVAKNYPVAKATDLYSIATFKDLSRICREIDSGLFVSNSKSAKWTKGGSFHHMNWDVKKVFITVKSIQPATSLQIDQSLPCMDRYRVSAILRELRKQELLIVT